ncbi:MAG TPA: acyltransferase [Candidatus Dormibacteraeota bacterium]|jgi:peptidoglycan/LPS O-acetylase OafA/YrhL|nr:acyltransferase [Candidatus Dormibacteraeota bacterium]
MRPRLNALTTLRFFAALHVVLFHMRVVGILPGGPWWYQNFASIGYVGVNFFFVLSGFILVYTYEGPELSARKFWWARFARIYPAYMLSLLVAAPFFFFAVRHLDLPFFAWSKEHLFWACALTLTLLQSWVPQGALTWNSVCWSLSVEAFFYLLFPFLLLRSRKLSESKLILCLLAFWFVSLFLSFGYVLVHPDGIEKINSGETTLFWKNILSFNPLVRLPEFVVGMLTCRLFLARTGKTKFATPLILAGLLGVAAVILFADKIPNSIISTGLLSPAFAAIIYGIAQQPKWTSFLAVPWLVLLGDASYSLYLLHSLVITRVFDSFPHWIWSVRAATSLAAAIAVSILAYRLVEEPARHFLRPKKPLA